MEYGASEETRPVGETWKVQTVHWNSLSLLISYYVQSISYVILVVPRGFTSAVMKNYDDADDKK